MLCMLKLLEEKHLGISLETWVMCQMVNNGYFNLTTKDKPYYSIQYIHLKWRKMRNILVVGGAGYIGSHTTNLLKKNGIIQ